MGLGLMWGAVVLAATALHHVQNKKDLRSGVQYLLAAIVMSGIGTYLTDGDTP